MKLKLLNFVPLIAAIFSFFLPGLRHFIAAHLSTGVVAALFAISEALAGTSFIKANSLVELLVNAVAKLFAPKAQ